MKSVRCLFLLAICGLIPVKAAEWIRAGKGIDTPKWGLKGGLEFALPPGGFTGGDGGPRGLIRLGYPVLADGACDLINFIAIEPVVGGQKGYSELEKSAFDSKQGKLLWTGDSTKRPAAAPHLDPGTLAILSPEVEELSVVVFVEKFDNGAHVRLKLSQRSDAPDELRVTVEAEPDSALIESCILTATMGNKARARLLFLADGPVSSLKLFAGYRDIHFADLAPFDLKRLPRNKSGDVVVAVATDEADPASVQALGQPSFWDYKGDKVTQYWRKPAAEVRPGLACVINGRYTYWMSKNPIPGGVAFENFELREPFKSGRSFIFGITRKNPAELLR